MSEPTASPFEIELRSHAGNVRERNEDFASARRLPRGSDGIAPAGLLAVVCDGVGGYPCGDLASRLAAKTFEETVATRLASEPSPEADHLALLDRAARDAHEQLLERMAREPKAAGMATTLSAALAFGGQIFTAQVGDSRIYRLRDSRLEQITDDQSPVGELLRAGALTKEEARAHPRRNIVSQVLGFSPGAPLQPDCRRETLLPGDALLLCTDGLPDSLDDDAIEAILLEQLDGTPARAADALLQAALDAGGHDNVTFVLALAPRLRA